MRSLVLAMAFLAICPFARALAKSNDEILEEAQKAFRAGVENRNRLVQARRDFSKAADAFSVLHKNGVRNPVLYRDLGNAAFLADRLPEAIWAYQLGLRLDPNDREIREQLHHARTKIYYPAAGQGRAVADSWPHWLHRPSEFQWFLAFALMYSLMCLAGVIAWARRSGGLAVLTIAAALLTGAAAAGMYVRAQSAATDRESPLVVVAANAPFHRGNGSSYPQHSSVPILPRGLEARIIHSRGEWLQLRLSTGEIGWLPRNQVLIVEP